MVVNTSMRQLGGTDDENGGTREASGNWAKGNSTRKMNATRPAQRLISLAHLARPLGCPASTLKRHLDRAGIAADGVIDAGRGVMPVYRVERAREIVGLIAPSLARSRPTSREPVAFV